MQRLVDTKSLPCLILYGNIPCPFVERVQITLKHLNVPHQFVYIELEDSKHMDFLKSISPYEQIPVIKLPTGEFLWESAVIVQYIDDEYDGKLLRRFSPYHRGMQRVWTHFCNKHIALSLWNALFSGEAKLDEEVKSLHSKMQIFEEGLNRADFGPFFSGNMLSFADIMLAPIFLRTHLLEHFRKRTAIPDDCMRVKNWMNEVLNHPDIKKTALQGKNLIDKYEPYVTGNHQLKRRWSY